MSRLSGTRRGLAHVGVPVDVNVELYLLGRAGGQGPACMATIIYNELYDMTAGREANCGEPRNPACLLAVDYHPGGSVRGDGEACGLVGLAAGTASGRAIAPALQLFSHSNRGVGNLVSGESDPAPPIDRVKAGYPLLKRSRGVLELADQGDLFIGPTFPNSDAKGLSGHQG